MRDHVKFQKSHCRTHNMTCLCRTNFPTCPQYSEVQEKYAQIFYILRKLTELMESELLSCLTGRVFELFGHYFGMKPQAHVSE